MRKNTNQRPWSKKINIFILLALLAIGLLFSAIQAVINASSYLQSYFVKVEYPQSYRFPIYNQLLKDNVKGGLVDYKTLVANKKLLNQAVKDLMHISPTKMENQGELLTFWINTHNLLSLKIITDKYPIKNTELLAQDCNLREFVIGGKAYSIEQIKRIWILPLIGIPGPY